MDDLYVLMEGKVILSVQPGVPIVVDPELSKRFLVL